MLTAMVRSKSVAAQDGYLDGIDQTGDKKKWTKRVEKYQKD